ncbi:MAG: YraN family protein [Acetivibrio sp.]
MNKRALGFEKEKLAAQFLEEKGYQVLEKNFYSHFGELDLICKKEEYLVFVEVKYRKELAYGYPLEAVSYRKQQCLLKTARYYLYKNKIEEETPCRFDMVSILGEKINIIENCLEF